MRHVGEKIDDRDHVESGHALEGPVVLYPGADHRVVLREGPAHVLGGLAHVQADFAHYTATQHINSNHDIELRGDTASGSVTKPARLETGIEVRVPFFIKEGEKIKVDTETRQFSGRA